MNSTLTHVEKDDQKISSSVKEQETNWIMCNKNDDIKSIGYNCESRPYLTVLLIVSIVIYIILRKSSFIKNWVASNQEKLQQQEPTDEEEGLMQRVF